MHPHLFWGVLALLKAVHIPLFVLILRVFNALLGSLQLWNLPCQQILQVASPTPLPNSAPPSGKQSIADIDCLVEMAYTSFS